MATAAHKRRRGGSRQGLIGRALSGGWGLVQGADEGLGEMVNPSRVKELDPKLLHFTEKDQSLTAYVGDPSRPILVYKNGNGYHVVDGHHRVLHAIEHGSNVNAVVMPHKTFVEFKKAGLHQGEMYRAYARRVAGKQNPESSAASMFESFHGKPSEQIAEFVEEEHYHGNLAELGVLVEMKVVTVSGYEVTLEFADDEEYGKRSNPGRSAYYIIEAEGGKGYHVKGGPFTSYVEAERSNLYKKGDQVITYKQALKVEKAGQLTNTNNWTGWTRNPLSPWFKEAKSLFGSKTTYASERLGPEKKRAAAKEKDKKEIAYKGQTIVQEGKGEFRVPAIDDGSFRRLEDAKEFVDYYRLGARAKNPNSFYTVDPEMPYRTKYFASLASARKHAEKLLRSTHSKVIEIRKESDSPFGELVEHVYPSDDDSRMRNPEIPDITLLCSNEDGTQLYFVGGDQTIDLKAVKMEGAKWEKDSMVIGELIELTYRTEKKFDKFKMIDYFHKLGEETGVEPVLIYDRLNERLSVSGGQYRIKRPLIGMSAGIEN